MTLGKLGRIHDAAVRRDMDRRYERPETCDLCHEPADELGEWGKLLICEKCLESKRDQAEAQGESSR